MPTPPKKPDQVLEVVDITLGTAGASATGAIGVAFRLRLRDGTHLAFGLTEAQTIQFAKIIQDQLVKIASLSSALKH
jgi:hypothetical protein